jgi:hypothetical protein
MNWNRKNQVSVTLTPLLFAWCLALAFAPTLSMAAGNHIDWQVVASSGPPAASSSHKLFSVTGQPTPVGEASNSAHRVRDGFMQAFGAGSGCCLTAGDANNDTKVNVGDAVFLINFVFKAGAAPPCKDQADANHDCKVNVGDAVFLINYVFKHGTAPECGCLGS